MLGLGSAQWGLDYGVSNPNGMTPFAEVKVILDAARKAGVRIIDTAPAYGHAEAVLGQAGVSEFDVVTKTLAGCAAVDIEPTFRKSLTSLQLDSAYGLIAHAAADLIDVDGDDRFAAMVELRNRGLVKRVGASAYTAEQVIALIDRHDIDLMQVPVNVFDQRLVMDGTLDELARRGIEVHARSVFLQGLLLMDPSTVPGYFAPWRSVLVGFHSWLTDRGLTPTCAALGFVCGLSQVDAAIVGVNDAQQLREVIDSSGALPSEWFAGLAVSERALIDPSTWEAA